MAVVLTTPSRLYWNCAT